MNRLISKGMSNTYLSSSFNFPGFKKYRLRSVFGELQLKQITLNFKTSCYN